MCAIDGQDVGLAYTWITADTYNWEVISNHTQTKLLTDQ